MAICNQERVPLEGLDQLVVQVALDQLEAQVEQEVQVALEALEALVELVVPEVNNGYLTTSISSYNSYTHGKCMPKMGILWYSGSALAYWPTGHNKIHLSQFVTV